MGKRKKGSIVPETTKRDCPHLKPPVREVKGQVYETLFRRGGHIGDGELGGVTAGAGQSLNITIRRQQIEEENRRDRERRERDDD